MVSMIRRFPLRVTCNQNTHALLCLSRERPAKMIIDSPDGSHRVTANLVVFQVANSVAGQSVALIQKFLHGLRPVLDCLPVNRKWINSVAKRAAKDRYET